MALWEFYLIAATGLKRDKTLAQVTIRGVDAVGKKKIFGQLKLLLRSLRKERVRVKSCLQINQRERERDLGVSIFYTPTALEKQIE